ncbi:MAG: hypothetical protein KDD38_01635 [Bdellovibrionales bacterium]|nr:hypothetical protein [Bdellovibrionales bacterium]
MKLFGKYRSIREMLENEDSKILAEKFPHGKPTSRRDLLKAGAISFTASVTAPSLLGQLLLPSVANAQAAGCTQNPAFVGLKLNGGAGLMGNWVALGENRDFIDTYSQLGLGPRSEIINRNTKVFGDAMFFDGSQILAGIRQTASATTLLNTSFVGLPVASNDDSANNPFDITYFVSKLGVVGSILPNLGRQQSLTGIAQLPALGKTPPTPLSVGSTTDIANALTVRGSLAALNDTQKASVFSLINKLSEAQTRELASATGGGVLAQLINQATGLNANLATSTNSGIDPLQDAAISQAFSTAWTNDNNQTMNQQAANARERVFGTMIYNSLKGNAGTTNLEMGGYDYHGQGRATQDARDLDAGRTMGRILESAAVMQRPVFLMVTSDGAVGAPAGSSAGAAFTGDRGSGGSIMCFAFHPLARPAAVNSSGAVDHQVGSVKGQAAVNTDEMTGNDPALAGLAAFANFASFSGMLGQFPNIAGSIWNSEQIERVTRLRKVG